MIWARFIPLAALVLAAACGGPNKAPAELAAPEMEAPYTEAVTAMADSWDGEVQFATYYNALDPSFPLAGAAEAGAGAVSFDPNDEYWGLPRDEGVDLVAGICSSCHSVQIIMSQRHSQERWSELITWMSDTQGMAPLPDDFRGDIEVYLAKHFGEDSP